MRAQPVPEGRAPRVLALVPEGRRSPAAVALAAAGCAVEIVKRAADLGGPLMSGTPDALLLDLSQGEAAGATEPEIQRALAAIPGAARSTRVIVIGKSPAGPNDTLHADSRLGSNQVAAVVREVHAAAAAGRLEAALREIERLRETVAFARARAHDLAQPLTTILARSQLLMNTLKPEDPHYRAISIICAETERLASAAGEFSKLKEMAAEPAVRKA